MPMFFYRYFLNPLDTSHNIKDNPNRIFGKMNYLESKAYITSDRSIAADVCGESWRLSNNAGYFFGFSFFYFSARITSGGAAV